MHTRPWNRLLVMGLMASLLWGCSPGDDPGESQPEASGEARESSQATTPGTPETATPPVAEAEDEAASPLADTQWRLVNIASMNDTNDAPEDRDLYTLAFNADGTVAVRADCNRGNGTWTSEGSQLTFGPMAATMAMCPPESLHDRYLAQFEWVRSYVMEDGHLFLATMADGSIIEFEPAPPE